MSQPAPALSSLRLLNSKAAGQLGEWTVRICNPYVESWSFTTKKEEVHAKKFVARLVSQDKSEYCLGVVPFDFRDRNGASDAQKRFVAGSVWKLQNVSLVRGTELQYLGCSVNVIVDLKHTTCTQHLVLIRVCLIKSST